MLQKPEVPISRLSYKPSRAYILSLLRAHIHSLAPARSLDAGFGRLRMRWAFPGEYVGIGLSIDDYLVGLAMPENAGLASPVYIMNLDDDFSFLGDFDLCVCTNTLAYVTDVYDVVNRLSARVVKGGSLIIESTLDHLAGVQSAMEKTYRFVDVIYWGKPELMNHVDDKTELLRLAELDMHSENTADGHARFYMIAVGKDADAGPRNPAPRITYDQGAAIVHKD